MDQEKIDNLFDEINAFKQKMEETAKKGGSKADLSILGAQFQAKMASMFPSKPKKRRR